MNKELREALLDIRTHLEHQRTMENHYIPRCSVERNATEMPEKSDNGALLNVLRKELGNCMRCKLSKERSNIVFGMGNPDADLMFAGEGPGFEEDKQGLPFVGRAGKLLDRILGAMGFERKDVYIANVVKCRPPNNRNPEADEIKTCFPFLKRQVEIIQPKIIVCLGTFAAQSILQTEEKISKLRGKFFEIEAFPGAKVLPTYHPAFLLRNPGMKKPVWEDMQLIMKELG